MLVFLGKAFLGPPNLSGQDPGHISYQGRVETEKPSKAILIKDYYCASLLVLAFPVLELDLLSFGIPSNFRIVLLCFGCPRPPLQDERKEVDENERQ